MNKHIVKHIGGDGQCFIFRAPCPSKSGQIHKHIVIVKHILLCETTLGKMLITGTVPDAHQVVPVPGIATTKNKTFHSTGTARGKDTFRFWCPVPVKVRTDTQTYRETYRDRHTIPVRRYQQVFRYRRLDAKNHHSAVPTAPINPQPCTSSPPPPTRPNPKSLGQRRRPRLHPPSV
jgi:hypothetical protein